MNFRYALLFVLCIFVIAAAPAQKKIQILLLGTYHFGGNTPDGVKVAGENVLGEKRQKEINEVLRSLENYRPQQIMVEYTGRYDSAINRIYRKYVNEHELPKQSTTLTSELFQLAMQLGKRLGLPAITPVDFQETEDTLSAIGKLNWQYRKQLGQYFRDSVKSGAYGLPEMTEIRKRQSNFTKDTIPNITVKEALLRLNSDNWQKDAFYTGTLCFMDGNPWNMGAELAEMTLFRHLHIFRNMVNRINPGTQKILLIIGASHVGPLRDWFRSHPLFEVIDISSFLY